MSDFFKNLRSLFLVEDDSADDHTDEKDVKSKPVKKDVLVGEGKVSSRFVDILLEAMSNNNLEGIDYLEYRNSLDSLRDMEMDEPTRFQSAFAMARTMGATPEVLINSTEHYVKVLEKEKLKFRDALENHKRLQIEKREKRIAELNEKIEVLNQQILELNQQIDSSEKEVIRQRDLKKDAEDRMKKASGNFDTSFRFVMERIIEDREKMKKYLNGE